MYYTIYKTTNLINGKYYIGKHQTKDLNDGYFGSGHLIKRAIDKYGIENFTKEILFVFDNEQEMNDKEKELVVVSEETYNLCPGGKGGFGYINRNLSKDKRSERSKKSWKTSYQKHGQNLIDDRREKIKKANSIRIQNIKSGELVICPQNQKGANNNMFGKSHSPETKTKMSKAHILEKNSQFGTMWVTDGKTNIKINKNSPIPLEFYVGRTISGRKTEKIIWGNDGNVNKRFGKNEVMPDSFVPGMLKRRCHDKRTTDQRTYSSDRKMVD